MMEEPSFDYFEDYNSKTIAQIQDKSLEGLREVSILGPGKSFGELALINSKPRMATIRC